jgi:hypothetical protein
MAGAGAMAQSATTTATLESRRATSDSALTADPDSEFWKGMPAIALDRHIITGDKMPELSAEVRSRWTDKNLYLLFVGKYPARNTKPATDLTTETYRLWLWDCFEAYVDNIDNPPHQYRELQMSPSGEWLDLAIDSTVERAGGHDERFWDSGMKVKARIDDANKMWIGEIQAPWTAFMSRPPKIGDAVRVNFYRQDGAGRPANNVGDPGRTFMAWQPTGAWNPHHPDKFGVLKLVGE